MTRLFSDTPIEPGSKIYLLGETESRYLRDILRMRAGEFLTICDTFRMEYEGSISNPETKRIEVLLSSGAPNRTEPPYEAILYQGLPKADKMSSVIQKAVELGATGICPVSCSRSVVKVSSRDAGEKTQRWQKVSLEAARQSGRGMVPRVFEPASFRDAVVEACRASDLVLIPWEEERSVSLFKVLETFADRFGFDRTPPLQKQASGSSEADAEQIPRKTRLPRISMFIGPEGGFDGKEVEFAVSRGALSVTLGKRILRTETAGPAVLSMLLYRLELP